MNMSGEEKLIGKFSRCMRIGLTDILPKGPRNSLKVPHTWKIPMMKNQSLVKCHHQIRRKNDCESPILRYCRIFWVGEIVCTPDQEDFLSILPWPLRATKSNLVPHQTLPTVINMDPTTINELMSVLGYTFQAHSCAPHRIY